MTNPKFINKLRGVKDSEGISKIFPGVYDSIEGYPIALHTLSSQQHIESMSTNAASATQSHFELPNLQPRGIAGIETHS